MSSIKTGKESCKRTKGLNRSTELWGMWFPYLPFSRASLCSFLLPFWRLSSYYHMEHCSFRSSFTQQMSPQFIVGLFGCAFIFSSMLATCSKCLYKLQTIYKTQVKMSWNFFCWRITFSSLLSVSVLSCNSTVCGLFLKMTLNSNFSPILYLH